MIPRFAKNIGDAVVSRLVETQLYANAGETRLPQTPRVPPEHLQWVAKAPGGLGC